MALSTAPERVRLAPAPGRPAGPRRPAPALPETPEVTATGQRSGGSFRRSFVLSAVLVVASLLAVVGADAYLTQGQARLTRVQQTLNNELTSKRELELQVAQLSSPSRIIAVAEQRGLVAPTRVTDLPAASEDTASTGAAPSSATNQTTGTGKQ